MRKQQLAQKFLNLLPSQELTLTTIKLPKGQDLPKKINLFPYFFAYQLLDAREFHRQFDTEQQQINYYELCSKQPLPLNKADLVLSRNLTVEQLYERLSTAIFRAEKELFFQRMTASRVETIREAKNPFLFLLYHQDVHCLSNLDSATDFLPKAHEEAAQLARRHRNSFTGDNDDQRAVQFYLTGTYISQVQIYLPPHQRELLFSMMRQARTSSVSSMQDMDVESENSSNYASSEMSSEEEEFLQQLRCQLQLAKEEEEDYEQKERSREKDRRF